MRIAISIENLSKKYILRHETPERYTALRDVLVNRTRAAGRNLIGYMKGAGRSSRSPGFEEFWALKDINFEIQEGERIGIIGRNGAGKSTLLKVLSRIVEPTTGRVTVRGRMASLLEVGTGFHPELTGKENIFLNASILGMSNVEVRAKFDEIVSFANVEKFLDTPVKRYSSGMYVRLAFAVAAHLEPDILVVDEVLAVGDAQFQKKCLGKMEEASSKGRTVIFVSHNMSMITSLCERAILLDSGRIAKTGKAADVVLDYYGNEGSTSAEVDFTMMGKKIGDDYAILLGGYVRNAEGHLATEIDLREPVVLGMRYQILRHRNFDKLYPYPSINLYASDGVCAFYSSPLNSQMSEYATGEYVAECEIPGNMLNSGTYFAGFGFSDCEQGVNTHFFEANALCFHVVEPLDATSLLYEMRNGFSSVIPGVVRPRLAWSVRRDLR
jgi:lipopolysaccharide transport system ATP-binding protein